MALFQLVGKHYVSQSPVAANNALINWYTELIEVETGRSQIALYPTSGLDQISTSTPTGPGRGAIEINGRYFCVIRSTFYEMSSAGVLTSRGTVSGTSGTVSMASSATQMLILSNQVGYIYTLATNVLAAIADLDFPTGGVVAGYTDGYFVVLSTNGNFYISALNDGTSWDALDFDTVSSSANTIIGMIIHERMIWIFGDKLTQPFFNSGNPDFPFEAVQSGTIQQGLGARFSVTAHGETGTLYWLQAGMEGAGVYVQATGTSVERVSDYSFDTEVAGYTTISDAIASCFTENGHMFCMVTFPTENVTWVYDARMKHWHKRLYWNSSTGEYEAHRALYHVYVFNKHIWLDRASGKVYEMKAGSVSGGTGTFNDDDGDVIRRLRRCPHVAAGNKTVFHKSLELIMETGLALSTGQGSDPQVMLRISDDGGKNYFMEQSISVGAIGEFTRRVKWDQLGSARDRVYEIVVTDPVPWRLISAELDAEVGLS